jgi:uncharacterized Zn finger protein
MLGTVEAVSESEDRLAKAEKEPHEDYGIDSDFDEYQRNSEEDGTVTEAKSHSNRRSRGKRTDVVRGKLESMSKDELVAFVIDLIGQYPEIGRNIEETEALKSGSITKIIRSIRDEIEELASETAWSDSWSGEGSIPDYSRVHERLQSLLDAGYPDAVVELGDDLWRLGNEQVGSSDDEGETEGEISECMEVVLQAVAHTSLAPRDKILWIVDAFLSDEYDLLYDSEKYLGPLNDAGAWSEVADALLARLDGTHRVSKNPDFSAKYRRQGIMNWAIKALEHSRRNEEIIPLLEREAPITQCCDTLVEHLISAGRTTEARTIAADGFRQTIDSARGTAWDLEAKLCRMAEQEKDHPLVAAYRWLEFLNRPSLESYKVLKKAAKGARQWPAVREAAIEYLETGKLSDSEEKVSRGKRNSKPAKSWPLPPTEIPMASAKGDRRHFPDTVTLIRIAIYEKDTSTILRSFEVAKKATFFSESIHDEVAEAVWESHPDVSLEIWRNLAEDQIKLVKPAAYQVAARYLRKMRDVYKKTQRLNEWTALVKSIRTTHKPKRSLMQILDTLEAKKIIDT